MLNQNIIKTALLGLNSKKINKISTQIDICPKEILSFASKELQLALKEASHTIKSYNKYKEFNLLVILTSQVFKSNNKKAAKELLISNQNNLELLMLFSDKEIFDILESNSEILNNNYDSLNFIVSELKVRTKWSKKFSAQVINYILDHQYLYNGKYFYKTLWNCLPYFHKDIVKIVVEIANSNQHKNACKQTKIKEFITKDLKKILEVNETINIFE